MNNIKTSGIILSNLNDQGNRKESKEDLNFDKKYPILSKWLIEEFIKINFEIGQLTIGQLIEDWMEEWVQ